MTRHRSAISERAEELLVDQVTEGLNPSEQHELNRLLDDAADVLENEFMQTTALVQLGMLAREGAPADGMPASLKQKIASASVTPPVSQATPTAAASVSELRPKPAQRSPLTSYAGWAMAAALALAFVVLRIDPPAELPASMAEQRMALLDTAADTIEVAWATPAEAAYAEVSGDVIWSDGAQQGFMRLRGMPVNDPAVAQYQLWIVDPERGEQPVDGGVFDIPTGSGEVIVPIDSKLAVGEPTVFAITLEQPGGVVVSKGPLLIVAPVTT
jgi:anti-sigma-K factor RskA